MCVSGKVQQARKENTNKMGNYFVRVFKVHGGGCASEHEFHKHGNPQKVLVRTLGHCLDALNWQQTRFQLEKRSSTQFKQSALIVLIPLNNHLQVSGWWWLFSGHSQMGHSLL